MKQVTVYQCEYCARYYDKDAAAMAEHEKRCAEEKRKREEANARFWAEVGECRAQTIAAAKDSKAVRALVAAGEIEEARYAICRLMTHDLNSSYLVEQILDQAIEAARETSEAKATR